MLVTNSDHVIDHSLWNIRCSDDVLVKFIMFNLQLVVYLMSFGNLAHMQVRDGDSIGCYTLGCLHFNYDANIPENLTTPDSCTASCKENGFSFAGVYNITKCSCSCYQTCREKPLPGDNCGLPCRSSPEKRCGGFAAVSLYTVTDPVTLNNTYCDHEELEVPLLPGGTPPMIVPLYARALLGLVAVALFAVIVGVVIKTCKSPSSCHISLSGDAGNPITPDHQSSQRPSSTTQALPRPPSSTGSTSHSLGRRRMQEPHANSALSNDHGSPDNGTLPGHNFYFTLVAQEDQNDVMGEDPEGDPPLGDLSDYAYACFPGESSMGADGEMTEKIDPDNGSKCDEEGMVINALYAMPQRKSSRK